MRFSESRAKLAWAMPSVSIFERSSNNIRLSQYVNDRFYLFTPLALWRGLGGEASYSLVTVTVTTGRSTVEPLTLLDDVLKAASDGLKAR